ncbi:hypothetical protein SAMN02745181_1851 [Rubritalea squalenifaciens DSM 18772]|uniref:Uncharacterized protein n=1 Tax=Rubritalea squalenifaciens DSM 18772 TaxID=1123071 RepID=A0A1M6ILL2_9BACT|nr:hypothetical protein [Rubritalea squalenifaciens]SHJ35287.1 hypothetical protein SAMN02745181_1851 [Rubritalea squalenifaciens DSM 18772]
MKSFAKTITYSAIIAMAALSPTTAFSQDDQKDNSDVVNSVRRFWQADLPGGRYMVALDRLSSVSMHSYMIKGAVVHEVNIETQGALATRIYVIEALGENGNSNIAQNLINRAKQLGDQAAKRTGSDANTVVTKEYPITTHAKTVEYRLYEIADLNQLYSSITKAWRENRGRKFTVK